MYTTIKMWFEKPHLYGHGAIIFIIFVYMLYIELKKLESYDIKPSLNFGTILSFIGCAGYFIGELSNTIILQQVSFILSIYGLILLVYGKKYFLKLFLVISYLIFLFPLFSTILRSQVIYLQDSTAFIAQVLLKIMGFSVFREGHLIQLPHIGLDVVSECSGVNHIMSLVAIAIPISIIGNFNNYGKTLLIILAAFIGIFANGIRVSLIGLWSAISRSSNVHGPADMLLVSFVFIFGIVILYMVVIILKKNNIWISGSSKSSIQNDMTNMNRNEYSNYGTVVALSMLILFLALGKYYEIRPIDKKNPQISIIHSLYKNSNSNAEQLIKKNIQFRMDMSWYRAYQVDDNLIAYVYLGYLSRQREGREIFNLKLNQAINIIRTISFKNNEKLDELSIFKFDYDENNYTGAMAYFIDGVYYKNIINAKIANFINILKNKNNNASIIVILFDENSSNNRIGNQINKTKFIENTINKIREQI